MLDLYYISSCKKFISQDIQFKRMSFAVLSIERYVFLRDVLQTPPMSAAIEPFSFHAWTEAQVVADAQRLGVHPA